MLLSNVVEHPSTQQPIRDTCAAGSPVGAALLPLFVGWAGGGGNATGMAWSTNCLVDGCIADLAKCNEHTTLIFSRLNSGSYSLIRLNHCEAQSASVGNLAQQNNANPLLRRSF